jgi:hypothetical protein
MQEITVKKIQEMVLETQEDKTLGDMNIYKSYCSGGSLGAVFFAVCGEPPRGYAMYILDEDGKAGTLHTFDEVGLKRKVIHCTIKDLSDLKNADVWRNLVTKPLEA